MAKEKWTVLYKVEDGGNQGPANWAEKAVVVKNKEKNAGFSTGEGLKTNEPAQCKIVTIEAEGAEEACLAVETFYGRGNANGKAMAALSSNLTEVAVS